MGPDEKFQLFFQRYQRELGRLAYSLVGEAGAADDLTAEAFVVAWDRWDRVRTSGNPLASMRGIVVKLAGSGVRNRIGDRSDERGGMGGGHGRAAGRSRRSVPSYGPETLGAPGAYFSQDAYLPPDAYFRPDGFSSRGTQPAGDQRAGLGVHAALGRLPVRQRACVVLRHVFHLSEWDTAEVLGVSLDTVQVQTSKGLKELVRLMQFPAGSRGGRTRIDRLGAVLREEVERHEPSSTRIYTRMQERMDSRPLPERRYLVSAAIVAVMVVAVVAAVQLLARAAPLQAATAPSGAPNVIPVTEVSPLPSGTVLNSASPLPSGAVSPGSSVAPWSAVSPAQSTVPSGLVSPTQPFSPSGSAMPLPSGVASPSPSHTRSSSPPSSSPPSSAPPTSSDESPPDETSQPPSPSPTKSAWPSPSWPSPWAQWPQPKSWW